MYKRNYGSEIVGKMRLSAATKNTTLRGGFFMLALSRETVATTTLNPAYPK